MSSVADGVVPCAPTVARTPPALEMVVAVGRWCILIARPSVESRRGSLEAARSSWLPTRTLAVVVRGLRHIVTSDRHRLLHLLDLTGNYGLREDRNDGPHARSRQDVRLDARQHRPPAADWETNPPRETDNPYFGKKQSTRC